MSQTLPQPSVSARGSSTDTAGPGFALAALLRSAALAPLPERGWVRVAGEDRVRWLNGMVTNAVAELTPGQGCYNFFLNAQGQIQADGDVFAREDDLLLATWREIIPGLLEMLDRFIIMDDVELADVSDTQHGLLVAGPQVPRLLQQMFADQISSGCPPLGPFSPATESPSSLSLPTMTWEGSAVTVVHSFSPLVPRFELWGSAATIDSLQQQLVARELPIADPATLETLRVLEGTPRMGRDLRGRELAQETAQTRALHFSKGCYLGQEIVERIRSRGQVHRTLTGLLLEGDGPEPGTELSSAGKAVGLLTSVADLAAVSAVLPGDARPALGYLRREALESRAEITWSRGRATAVSLPFRLTAELIP